ALLVTDPNDYRYFPPFKAGHNANVSLQLGGETYEIAKALLAGEGFSHPHKGEKTGPTSWAGPLDPASVASLLWIFDGDMKSAAAVLVVLRVVVLIFTGCLVLMLVKQTAPSVNPWLASAIYLLLLVHEFRAWFQQPGGVARSLLLMDFLLAGF